MIKLVSQFSLTLVCINAVIMAAPAMAYDRAADYDVTPALYVGSLMLSEQGTLYGAGYRHLNSSWLDLGAELYTDPTRSTTFVGTGTIGGVVPLHDLLDVPLAIGGALQGGTYIGGTGWYLNVPVGLRYLMKRGGIQGVVETAYHFGLLNGGFSQVGDPAHFRFSGLIRGGAFGVSIYKDVGTAFNGLGGQVGLSF